MGGMFWEAGILGRLGGYWSVFQMIREQKEEPRDDELESKKLILPGKETNSSNKRQSARRSQASVMNQTQWKCGEFDMWE